jgi:hypothetical protein
MQLKSAQLILSDLGDDGTMNALKNVFCRTIDFHAGRTKVPIYYERIHLMTVEIAHKSFLQCYNKQNKKAKYSNLNGIAFRKNKRKLKTHISTL